MQTNPFEDLAERLDRIEQLLTAQKEPPQADSGIKLLTAKETAEKLNISVVTLIAYRKAGKIKGKRLGRRVLYSEDDIREALRDIPVLMKRR